MLQSNVCNGSIYFNYCLDYSVGLTDPWIFHTLILDAHLMVNKFKEFSKNFAVTYRGYFRLLSFMLKPTFNIIPSKMEETVFL